MVERTNKKMEKQGNYYSRENYILTVNSIYKDIIVAALVLVYYVCCKNLPQIWWFNTIQVYSLTVLETSSKSVLLD